MQGELLYNYTIMVPAAMQHESAQEQLPKMINWSSELKRMVLRMALGSSARPWHEK